MSDDLFLDQFRRLLSALDAGGSAAELEESGFLDLLRSEDDGGAGLSLEDFFPLALEAGRWPGARAVVHTIVARAVDGGATDIANAEAVLKSSQVEAVQAKAIAAATTAALMAGAMAFLLDTTLEYAGTRKQFGREISKFQAIQHHLAVMAEETMAARMAAQIAFQGALLEMSLPRAAAAKVRVGQAAQQVAAIAHAVHGAIGMSQEHVLHKYTGALQQGRMLNGGESYWARKLGRHALAQGDAFATMARKL